MEEPTDEEVIDYVADMADQLAAMCGTHYHVVAVLLRGAAKAARDRVDDEPEPCASCGD